MKIVKAYKYRLKTNSSIEHASNRCSGDTRFIWNKVLALNLERLKNKQKRIWRDEMSFWLTLWKQSEEYGFLKNKYTESGILQQKLIDLDRAFRDAFDKTQPLKKMPVFKKKGGYNSFRYSDTKRFEINGNRIKLPKIGWVNFFNSRPVEGVVKNITVSKTGKYWYASLQFEQEVEKPIHSSISEIGVDVGTTNFACTSDGSVFAPIRAFATSRTKLAKMQRKLRLKKKSSNNWRKHQQKISILHSKIANTRNDYLHRLGAHLSKNHARVFVEDLCIKNMSKSAKGTIDAPGKNVKAKSGLNRSILGQGWGKFKRQLAYKLEWLGGKFILVNPKYTSQSCSSCGYTDRANRSTQAQFICLSCGFKDNADINAAKNILAVGQTATACGEKADVISMKQEPLGESNLLPA